jgi:aspartate carbamoyltransferase catalytic subunit
VRNLVSIDQLSQGMLDEIFQVTDDMAATLRLPARLSTQAGRVIALLFYEASSRTILSFEAAAARLGAAVITHKGSASTSSLSKGESLEDTVKVVGSYADLLVLRHEDSDAARRAAAVCPVPFISGGDGSNEHPTQALVDLYSIARDFGRLESLRVGMGFDPRHSRSLHSLCRALSYYPDNEILLVGPEELWLNKEEIQLLQSRGLRLRQSIDPADLADCEIVYLNRFQTERIQDKQLAQLYRNKYRMGAEDLEGSKIQLLLDPLPRIHEIDFAVDQLPQAGYFRQAAYGVPVRMALLSLMMP